MKKFYRFFKNQGIITFSIAAAILFILLSMFRFKEQVNTFIDKDMRSQVVAIQQNSIRLIQNEMNYLKRLTASAAQLMNQSQLQTDQEILKTLEDYSQTSNIVRALFVTLDGHIYTSYEGYLGQNDLYSSIDGIPLSEIKEPFFSKPFYSEELNEVIFGVVSPVTMGQQPGILISSYNISQFYDLLKNEFVGGMAEIGIINREGFVVAGKDISEFSINAFDRLSKVSFSNSSVDEMKANLANGLSGFSNYNVYGISRYCSYAPIGYNDWYIIVIVKEVSLHSNLIQLEKYGVQLSIELIVIMAALLSIIIAGRYKEQNKVRLILQQAAMLDGLTGIYNRRTAEDEITKFLNASKQQKDTAMLVIDIDNFKMINDNLGHIFGDLVLRECASRLQDVFEEEAIIGRIGGDEFVVFIKNCPDADFIHKKTNDFISNFHISNETYGEKIISVSVGVALSKTTDTSFLEMYQKADASLYRAKNQGKGRYSF